MRLRCEYEDCHSQKNHGPFPGPSEDERTSFVCGGLLAALFLLHGERFWGCTLLFPILYTASFGDE